VLLRHLADIRDEASIVRALLVEARGTAGRLVADSALIRQLRRVEREVAATMEDIKKNPQRYIVF
jgi:hypothetical protein